MANRSARARSPCSRGSTVCPCSRKRSGGDLGKRQALTSISVYKPTVGLGYQGKNVVPSQGRRGERHF
eukprot:6657139-Prymnesium_polylepis.1